MILDINYQHRDYIKDILPFIRKGIIIDTSVIKILLEGIISSRISNKETPELNKLLAFLDFIKVNNRWEKFFITPHILTQVCSHINRKYNGQNNYKEIICEILPILECMVERQIGKDRIVGCVDIKNPIIEIGDLSIFLWAEDFTKTPDKVAILVKDKHFNERYKHDPRVMIMDYNQVILNRM